MCQEVTFLLIVTFLSVLLIIREKKFTENCFFLLLNQRMVGIMPVCRNKLLTLKLKVTVLIYEKERGNRVGN